GPGDPEPCTYAIETARTALERKIPLFGICLGQQILGLGLTGRTVKMKTGHHGANHPVKDVETGLVFITSQNHGFNVDPESLPDNVKVTHVSLFDGTLQGFELTDRPAFCFQGHPQASPGPHDIVALFDKFISLLARQKLSLMPKHTDIPSILVIGAGPIIIGQACEFHHSGAPACTAQKAEGYRTVRVDSNPATIMNDPD